MSFWQVFGLLIFNGLFDNVLSQLHGLHGVHARFDRLASTLLLFYSPISATGGDAAKSPNEPQ